jgi:uncharacterized protein YdaU (DUF1376 family)
VKHRNPPAFQLYAGDWLASETISAMTAQQEGWYIRLLCHAWNSHPCATLPNDTEFLRVLARAAKEDWQQHSGLVLKNFRLKNGRLVNHKLFEHHKERDAYIKKQRDNGKKGADAKWHGGAKDSPEPPPMANDGSSIYRLPSSNSSLQPTASGLPAASSGGTAQRTKQPLRGSGESAQSASQRQGQPGTPSLDPGTGHKQNDSSDIPEGELFRLSAVYWALHISTYWMKPGMIKQNSLPTILKQFDKWCKKVPAQKRTEVFDAVKAEEESRRAPAPVIEIEDDQVDMPASKCFQIED